MIASNLLDNGLRVITEHMEGSRSIAIGVMVKTGPRDEDPDKSGLAHLLEHALFHGTSSRTSGEIARMVDTMGGRVGAFTGRDYTCFSAVVMDDHRTYVFDLLSDMLLNSIFPEQKLEHEKNVIISECEMEKDHPGERSLSLLKSTMWKDHPLGRAIEGSSQTIAGLTREDVIYFLHNTYLPNRITIAVTGNLDHDDIVAQVRDCFWRLSGHAEVDSPGKTAFTNSFVREERDSSQAYFSVGLQAPSYDHPQRYPVHILNTVLGGGLSSRLYRKIREDKGLVYDIHSEYHAYMETGALIMSGSSRPEVVFDVVDEVISTLHDMVSGVDPVSEEELWQAKLYNVGQHHIDSEDPYTRMSRLLTQHFYFGRVLPAQEVIKGLESVSTESIETVCGDLFTPFTDQVAASVVGPLGA